MNKDDEQAVELLKKALPRDLGEMPDTTYNPDKERGEQMLTPQQEEFLEAYYEPTSPTFGKVYQSAIQAGYSDSYAKILRSPSINNQWIRYNKRQEMKPEHIIMGIQHIAISKASPRDKLKAYELLMKVHGMLVDRSITGTINIEAALKDLK